MQPQTKVNAMRDIILPVVSLIFCATCFYVTMDSIKREREALECLALWKSYAESLEQAKDEMTVDDAKEEDNTQLPIGLANNNPLNVKGRGWAGQIGNDKFGHAIFKHPYYGLRAGAKVLKTYQQKHNLKTIEQIVSRYAEGNREAYAKYLAKHLGVSVNDEIKVQEHMPMLIKAMVMFECGQQPFHEATFALLGTSTNM